jgi:hypothetical protein
MNDIFVDACISGDLSLVNNLLHNRNIDPGRDDSLALRETVRSGHTSVVERLLQDPRVDPTSRENESIYDGMVKGRKELVAILLQQPHVYETVDKYYILRWAITRGYMEIIKMLLDDPFVDPSVDSNYLIRYAIGAGQEAIALRLLQDPRVDPTENNSVLIMYAASHQCDNVLRYVFGSILVLQTKVPLDLLEKYLDTEVVEYYFHSKCKRTYLQQLVDNGYSSLEVIHLMKKFHLDPRETNLHGENLLHHIIPLEGYDSLLQYCVEKFDMCPEQTQYEHLQHRSLMDQSYYHPQNTAGYMAKFFQNPQAYGEDRLALTQEETRKLMVAI